MMLEKNSDDIAKYMAGWMDKNIPQKDKSSMAMPPASIPTFTVSSKRSTARNDGITWIAAGSDRFPGSNAPVDLWLAPEQILAANPGLKAERLTVGKKIFIPAPK